MTDRRVHGWTRTGEPIVRYDVASKWYIESREGKRRVSLAEAVEVCRVWKPGVPGGSRFDALVARAGNATRALEVPE